MIFFALILLNNCDCASFFIKLSGGIAVHRIRHVYSTIKLMMLVGYTNLWNYNNYFVIC